MRVALAVALALAIASVAHAERVPRQPGHITLEAAVESGQWRWAGGRSVRATDADLRCVETQGTFH
ncbi:MAG TPA: hypothetical protein VM915_15595, partial [Verrucomicrobiae bacterium]|nr:hypothetical protein [Verrucomicrobiae bacterium]